MTGADLSFLKSGDQIAFVLVDGSRAGMFPGHRLTVIEVGSEWLKLIDQDRDVSYIRKDALTCVIVIAEENRKERDEKKKDILSPEEL